jgi:hypothetical protein
LAGGQDRLRWQLSVTQKGQQILHGRDEMVLQALALQAAPAGALEAVLRGRSSKASFQQPLAALSISSGRIAVGLGARQIEQFLPGITLERTSRFVFGALRAQRTCDTSSARRSILVIATPLIEVREAIFRDDRDRERFLKTLGKACGRTERSSRPHGGRE